MKDSEFKKNNKNKFKPYFTGVIFFAVIFFAVFGLAENSLAVENHYVRAGSGNTSNCGDSWANACEDLNNFTKVISGKTEKLTRGDTYYIADGVYKSYTFDDAIELEKYIYIKKAIESSHGSDNLNWNSSYGDGQAVFRGTIDYGTENAVLNIDTSYWLIDGQKRTSKDSGHGFKVEITSQDAFGIYITSNKYLKNISIKYTEMVSLVEPAEGNSEGGYSQITGSDIYMGYCYLHDLAGSMSRMRMIDGAVIEHNFYTRVTSWGGLGPHGDAIQLWGNQNSPPEGPSECNNLVVRYNEFSDIEGTGFISFAWGNDNVHVYGNVFYLNPDTDRNGCGNGIIRADSVTDERGFSHFYVYNNVIANIHKNKAYIWIINPVGTEQYAYNNLWYNCSYDNSVTINNYAHHGYNYISNSKLHWQFIPDSTTQITNINPFVNSISNNFNLSFSVPGKNLTQESWWDPKYDSNLDMAGNTRGNDEIWDIGAYEYTGTTTPDTTPPSAPSGLSVR